MSINLTEVEKKELNMRFSKFVINESVETDQIVHTLSTGKIIKGNITAEGVLEINSISNFLCG
jgi:hypothetical protein